MWRGPSRVWSICWPKAAGVTGSVWWASAWWTGVRCEMVGGFGGEELGKFLEELIGH